ncbi:MULTISPECIES: hypothetical protein [unclassified Bradyrhizobium]|uniref:hypothetical protein n=1 Tax=unclassified Bradyrhizobium TaxID=2631580 RepID=UPI00244D5F2D|nr:MULTISPECIES: hypothetical protein [unclassified Bradyrhizobium]MDH2342905.1 hypothetical protein [Bradyrhizobium sp. SSUT77]MDH2352774.1 hypothetical protein [Bradyrhizobium sp. SSUT112]
MNFARGLERRVISPLGVFLFCSASQGVLLVNRNSGCPAEVIMSAQQLHCDNSDKNADDLQQRSGREHPIEESHDAAF